MSIDLILAAALGVGVVVGMLIVLRRLWVFGTDPSSAYRAGRWLRRAAEKSAHSAGQATGVIDSIAGVVARSFKAGRDTRN